MIGTDELKHDLTGSSDGLNVKGFRFHPLLATGRNPKTGRPESLSAVCD